MPTITRKIQINFISSSKDERNTLWSKLRKYMEIVHIAANRAVNHLYLQDHVSDMVYLSDTAKDVVMKLTDEKKTKYKKGNDIHN